MEGFKAHKGEAGVQAECASGIAQTSTFQAVMHQFEKNAIHQTESEKVNFEKYYIKIQKCKYVKNCERK